MADGHRSNPPAPVSPETLVLFHANGNPAPDISDPKMDWNSASSSSWNKPMIQCLAMDFYRQVEAGKVQHVRPGSQTSEGIHRDIVRKMEDQRKNWRIHCNAVPSMLKEQELAKSRRKGRTLTVRVCRLTFDCMPDMSNSHTPAVSKLCSTMRLQTLPCGNLSRGLCVF